MPERKMNHFSFSCVPRRTSAHDVFVADHKTVKRLAVEGDGLHVLALRRQAVRDNRERPAAFKMQGGLRHLRRADDVFRRSSCLIPRSKMQFSICD